MKILIVVDMQKDFISGPLGTAEARAIVPYVAEKAKNTPRENLFVTLDTHQPNYMETNEGRHLPVPHCIEGTEGHALDNAIADRCGRHSGVPHHPQADVRLGSPDGHAPRAAGTADGN